MEWLAEHARGISAFDAGIEAAIAVLVPVLVRRRIGRVPRIAWLVSGYFLLEALVSISRAAGPSMLSRIVVFEVVGTIAIVAILLRASHLVDGMLALVDAARARAVEYERARRDYMQVVRHRINNPLTVIKGAAQTLDEAEIVDEAMRHALRVAIIDAAQALEDISLAPERQGIEEHELDAIPHVPMRDGA